MGDVTAECWRAASKMIEGLASWAGSSTPEAIWADYCGLEPLAAALIDAALIVGLVGTLHLLSANQGAQRQQAAAPITVPKPAVPKVERWKSPALSSQCRRRLQARGWTETARGQWCGRVQCQSAASIRANFTWNPELHRWDLLVASNVPDWMRRGFELCWTRAGSNYRVNYHRLRLQQVEIGRLDALVDSLNAYAALQEEAAGLRRRTA